MTYSEVPWMFFYIGLFLHTKDAEPRVLLRRIERYGKCERPHHARIGRLDHTVVPPPRRRVVRVALQFVLRARIGAVFFQRGFGHRLAARLGAFATHLSQHVSGLFAAHYRDAGVWPHPQKMWIVGAAAHAVI